MSLTPLKVLFTPKKVLFTLPRPLGELARQRRDGEGCLYATIKPTEKSIGFSLVIL